MPLRDHFHAPLYPMRSWESFLSRWANAIADYPGGLLSPRHFAEIYTHLGLHADAVAEWPAESAAEGQAVAVQTYSPPAPAAVIPVVFPDEMEVQIVDDRGTARLVAVMQWEGRFRIPDGAHLYAVAYRPTHRADRDEIDAWWERLAVGGGVPTLPLGLRGAFTVPLDLGACYEEACRRAGV